ncbi:phosphorothioated DNA-binding restriction endonuclease [Paenibacillus sp. NPDC057934]|uniref:phosphorothioated DNA-binding restriction endonuclease n=1 Tax=Paenibacillus sp. NPDC057934 TaxID=3346282 RepID=UPI0036DF5885
MGSSYFFGYVTVWICLVYLHWVVAVQLTEQELKERINNLTIWRKKEQRAPHKPLLLLLALSRLQAGEKRLTYEETRIQLKELLIEFGPRRRRYCPEEPFVRLTTDGLWALNKPVSKKQIQEKLLLEQHITGGFEPEVLVLLEKRPALRQEVAEQLLHAHFPETMHPDILEAVGFELEPTPRKKRDPQFRNRILTAYEYSCAVCGFNVRLGSQLVAIDAAHIQWHQAGGPDQEENGIALCTLHHKLFDRGVFTITNDRRLLVAEEAHGTRGLEEWLMRYHGTEIRSPISPLYRPKLVFLEWHVREVFKGPARYIYGQ